MTIYQHVTDSAIGDGNPKSVTILAMGPTHQDFLTDSFNYDPGVPPTDEIWLINKGFRHVRGDVVFILDDLIGEKVISPGYAANIDRLKIPVITSIVDQPVETAFPNLWDAGLLCAYPIEQVIDFWGMAWLSMRSVDERNAALSSQGKQPITGLADQGIFGAEEVRDAGKRVASYLRNSVPMILAYAAMIGVRTIHLFGADYDFPGQSIHEEDKPNTEYWVGLLYGQGIELRMSSNTTLLKTREGRPIYGYGKRQPRL